MRTKTAIGGIILGAVVWHTDTFQRVAFPESYWTKQYNKAESDVEFTEHLIGQNRSPDDPLGPVADKDEVADWQDFLADARERRDFAMSELAKARSY